MSYYRNRLQEAMLKVVAPRARRRWLPTDRFYAVCEAVAYATFLSGWLVAIVTHL